MSQEDISSEFMPAVESPLINSTWFLCDDFLVLAKDWFTFPDVLTLRNLSTFIIEMSIHGAFT